VSQLAETWTRAEAESWAAAFASAHVELLEQQKSQERLKEQLRRYLELEGLDELIDGETGEGVALGPAPRTTGWDTMSAPESLILALHRRGLLDVRTQVFDALVRAGGGSDLDEAKHYRITGEGTRPLKVAGKP
jgi:hypothetical protein